MILCSNCDSIDNAIGVFLVMDFVEYDLKKFMSTDMNYNEDHIVTIAYNLLCAVNFTQTANIMHRDIKPANILVDQ